MAASYSLSPLDVWSPVSSTQWIFDDGTTRDRARASSHAFASPGDHIVVVTATDALGNATSATRVVSVAAAPRSRTIQPPRRAAAPPPPPPAACTGLRHQLPAARRGDRLRCARHASATRSSRSSSSSPPCAGTAVHVRCTGRGCPFKTRTRTVTKSARRLDLTSLVRGAQAAPRRADRGPGDEARHRRCDRDDRRARSQASAAGRALPVPGRSRCRRPAPRLAARALTRRSAAGRVELQHVVHLGARHERDDGHVIVSSCGPTSRFKASVTMTVFEGRHELVDGRRSNGSRGRRARRSGPRRRSSRRGRRCRTSRRNAGRRAGWRRPRRAR